jgi:hypothetical protein
MKTSHRFVIGTVIAATALAGTAGTAVAGTTNTARPAAAPAAGPSGYLQWGQRSYYPQGCVHNGNHAICTFAFINQGNMATINATPGGELWGTQFVDNGHVPHNFDSFYFVDTFGSHQNQLIVQRGDRGTLVLEFAQVDPAVTFGEFHLQSQILAGISVNQPGNAMQASAAPQPGQVAPTSQPVQTGYNQPQQIPQQTQVPAQALPPAPCDPVKMGATYCKWKDKLTEYKTTAGSIVQ